jgi:hypothetical protein
MTARQCSHDNLTLPIESMSLTPSFLSRRAGAETARYALDCLEVLTLVPCTLHECCLEEVADQRTGIQVHTPRTNFDINGWPQVARNLNPRLHFPLVLLYSLCFPPLAWSQAQSMNHSPVPPSRAPNPRPHLLTPPVLLLFRCSPPPDSPSALFYAGVVGGGVGVAAAGRGRDAWGPPGIV